MSIMCVSGGDKSCIMAEEEDGCLRDLAGARGRLLVVLVVAVGLRYWRDDSVVMPEDEEKIIGLMSSENVKRI